MECNKNISSLVWNRHIFIVLMVFNFTTVGKYVSLEEALNTYSRLPITSYALPLRSCFKT